MKFTSQIHAPQRIRPFHIGQSLSFVLTSLRSKCQLLTQDISLFRAMKFANYIHGSKGISHLELNDHVDFPLAPPSGQ